MAWIILPARGIGPLCIGMTPDEVAALPIMGKPGHVYRGSGGRRMEYRGPVLPICEYENGALTRIICGRHVPGVCLEGFELFATTPQDLVRQVEGALGPITLCNEQLCFLGAGVMLGGFYDARDGRFFEPEVEYHDERSVTIYAPGTCPGDCETREAVSFL